MSEETVELVEYLDVPVYEEHLDPEQHDETMMAMDSEQVIDGEVITIGENEMQEVQFLDSDEVSYDTATEELQTIDGHTIIVHNGKQYMIPDELRRAGQTIVLNEDEDGEYIVQAGDDAAADTGDTYYTQIVDDDNDDDNDQEEQEQQQMYLDEDEQQVVQKEHDDGCYLIYDDEDDDLQTTEQVQVKDEPAPLAKQYAVLKDGKLHIETNPHEDEDQTTEADEEIQQKLQALENTFIYEADEREPGEVTPPGDVEEDEVDTDVTGTNLITGQTISLSGFFEKIRQRSSGYSSRQEPSDSYPASVKRQRRAYYQKTQVAEAGSDYVLVPPVHKQVVVGRTPDGKRIIGKILQIRKKIEPKVAKPVVRRRPRIVSRPQPRVPPPVQIQQEPNEEEEQNHEIEQLQKKLHPTHNVIVKKRYVSKAFLDQNIVRTLSGLMDMETIEKNLTGKNLIVRHVLKRSHGGVVQAGKEVTYYYGRMQRQSAVNCFNEPCSGWTFVSNQLSDDEDEGETNDDGIDLKLKQEDDNQQIDSREMTFGALAAPLLSGGGGSETSGSLRRIQKQQRDSVPTVTLILVVTQDEHGKKRTKVMIPQLAGNLQQQQQFTPPPAEAAPAPAPGTAPSASASSYTWSCESCTKYFRSELQLQRHNCTVEPQPQYACRVCRKSCNTSSSLRRHEAMHTLAGSPKALNCDHCDQRFAESSALLKHVTLRHNVGAAKTHTCDLCGKRFAHLGDLNYHRKVHETVRAYQCNVCGKHFNRHSNMVRHAFVHRTRAANGKAAFRCETCGCQYNFVSSLTRHIVNNHMGVNEGDTDGIVQEIMMQEAIQA